MIIVGIMKWYIRKQVQLASPIIKTFKDLADEYGPMVKSYTGDQLASIKVRMHACTFIIKGTHNMAIQVVEFSNGGYKIRNIFA